MPNLLNKDGFSAHPELQSIVTSPQSPMSSEIPRERFCSTDFRPFLKPFKQLQYSHPNCSRKVIELFRRFSGDDDVGDESMVCLLAMTLESMPLIDLRKLSGEPHQGWLPAQTRNTVGRMIRSGLSAGCSGFPHWREELGNALQDTYLRRHSKHARSWPHKKHDPPIKPPRIQALPPNLQTKGRGLIKQQPQS
ncbi:MAG TPA: hypothetical protein VNQ76_22115 [Planctomicrobium sp.]|nr:hypothetical protein [Planctomicrobium sp.]